jgi:hypothetical protein
MKRLCQIILLAVILSVSGSAPYNLPILRQHHPSDLSWLESKSCAAPCWENLSPGQTTYADGLERIQHNAALTILPLPPHDPSQDITWASTILVQHASRGTPTADLWFHPADTENLGHPDSLLTITFGVPKGTTLGDIIRWRGDPTRYALRCLNCFEAPDLLFLHLYYDAEQMEVLTTAIPRPHSMTWTIDWNQPIMEVIYESNAFYATNPPSCFWPAANVIAIRCF